MMLRSFYRGNSVKRKKFIPIKGLMSDKIVNSKKSDFPVNRISGKMTSAK